MGTFLFGAVIVFLVFIALLVFLAIIAKAYVKAPANRAFVRTGRGAQPKVVMNGGAFVFGFIHEITWVDLGTMAIEIERTEQNALLTRDPQYADIRAIFYIKVNPTIEGIVDAARTIGGKAVDATAVKQLVDAKLDGALRAFHRALKPGGVLGVVDHRGRTDLSQAAQMKSGYVREDVAIELIERAGFRLVGRSEVNANPRDTRDHPAGVWTLPPTYRLKDQDRAKYAAIGESDRFTLKFVRQ